MNGLSNAVFGMRRHLKQRGARDLNRTATSINEDQTKEAGDPQRNTAYNEDKSISDL